ncbi:MAG TPA: prepilin-type N-terminal cleavage/methylation domain-containing protein [Thermoanaerobaculia bacterium]|jgi:prepilin-type N-terminal cleavage/methylation domain-containing protein
MRKPFAHRRGEAGFSLIELLIVIALIALMAVWGVPAFLNTLNRVRVTAAAREIATLMQVARLEAIKRSGQNGNLGNEVTAVTYDEATRTFRVDVDDQLETAPDPGAWDPDSTIGGIYVLPKNVTVEAPGGVAEDAVDGWDEVAVVEDQWEGPIFHSDGSARAAGAFRLFDSRGNYLEVRIDFPATGKIAIQKWFGGDTDTDWFENGEANHKWQWY